MRTLAAVLAVIPLAIAVPSPTAHAVPDKPKSPPACGAKILPLVVGNTWTYVAGVANNVQSVIDARIAPRQPTRIVINVKSIEPRGSDTIVALEETITYELAPAANKKPAVTSEIVVNSTIKCNATRFEISPDSFLFSGEPGGYRALRFDKFDRSKDTSLKLTNGTIGDAPWREDIVAHFTRIAAKGSDAKLSAGKLELERAFTPAISEPVTTKSGINYPKPEKLGLVTTGRVTFDTPMSPQSKPSELPADWRSLFWFEPNVGLVKTQNMYAHVYELADSQLK